MKRPLVKDVRAVIKKYTRGGFRAYLEDKSVAVLFKTGFVKVGKISKELKKIGLELWYCPTYCNPCWYKFCVTKKGDKDGFGKV